jgi:hypothetical protein
MGVPIRDLLINAERFRLFARQKRRIPASFTPDLNPPGQIFG